MRVIQIYNRRKVWGGEDLVVDTLNALINKRGDYLYSWIRNNSELGTSLIGKMRAFIWGIYSPSAYRGMVKLIQSEDPDVVHVHNIYPLFSPSVLIACRQAGVPVLVHCHSYYLTCPITFHFHDGEVCEQCYGGREYWCILKNCRRNIFESMGYALRSIVARKLRLFKDNVTLFITLTKFAKYQLIQAGFNKDKIVIVPNMVVIPDSGVDASCGNYIAYVGRLSPEKGVETLLSAAARFPDLPIRVAGDGTLMRQLVEKAPKNVEFVRWLDRGQLARFYRLARFLVIPSIWFEPFGLVVAEAMGHGLPVIGSRIRGALPELVEDGVTGFLFEPGNTEDLADKMKLLWENPELCKKMGQAGREKAIREYSEDVFYERLMAVYRKAIEINDKR